MSPTTAFSVHGAPIRLGIRKGSINAPLALLLPTLLLFFATGLQFRFDRLGAHLGLIRAPTEPLMLDGVATPLEAHSLRAKELVLADDFPSTLTASP